MKPNAKATRRREPAAEDILWLKDYLPYRVGVVGTRMLREAGRIYKRRADPLTTAEFRIMAILANFEPLAASEISDISMLDKVAVSRALAQLTRRGFVQRRRTRQDQRILEITLTGPGWDYYFGIIPAMRQQESRFRSIVDRDDIERLMAILERFDAFFAALDERRRLYGERADLESVLKLAERKHRSR